MKPIKFFPVSNLKRSMTRVEKWKRKAMISGNKQVQKVRDQTTVIIIRAIIPMKSKEKSLLLRKSSDKILGKKMKKWIEGTPSSEDNTTIWAEALTTMRDFLRKFSRKRWKTTAKKTRWLKKQWKGKRSSEGSISDSSSGLILKRRQRNWKKQWRIRWSVQ